MAGTDQLAQIGAKLRNNEEVPPVTVRTFLSWFGAQRRSFWNVFAIRNALKMTGLRTTPDFESAYIDSNIRFEVEPIAELDDSKPALNEPVVLPAEMAEVREAATNLAISDPTYRISKLEAANRSPTCISPDASIQQAVTLMMANDFSQLPVVTTKRDIKGILSWSSIGPRLIFGDKVSRVGEAMDVHQELRSDASIFHAIPVIVQHSYV